MNTSFSLWQSLANVWLSLTEVHPSIERAEMRRRVRLLLSMALVFLVLNIVGALVVFGFASGSEGSVIFIYAVPPMLAVVRTAAAYVLGRTRQPMSGVYLVMLNVAIVAYGAILATPAPDAAIKYAPLIVTSTLISGLFLNVRRTAWLALLTTLGLLLVILSWESVVRLVFTNPADAQWIEPMEAFVILVTLIMVTGMNACILIFMRLRDQLEKERLVEEKRAIEQQQLALSYKRSDEVKSAFLASMSHELRTPLNAIINFTRFIVDGDTGPINTQQKDLLTDVLGSSQHLLALINDVLDMSKIEAGSLVLFIEDDVDLKALLNTSVATARSLLVGKPVRLHVDLPADLTPIRADRQRVLQVLLNIISNACKFTEEGDIRIRAQCDADEVIISVADTGPGIAPEDQTLVFEAFKQTTTGIRQGGGTGLGMPIAKSLVEVHGGRMWLESVLGQGATFSIALPVRSSSLTPVLA